jgi:hypothetical protein
MSSAPGKGQPGALARQACGAESVEVVVPAEPFTELATPREPAAVNEPMTQAASCRGLRHTRR